MVNEQPCGIFRLGQHEIVGVLYFPLIGIINTYGDFLIPAYRWTVLAKRVNQLSLNFLYCDNSTIIHAGISTLVSVNNGTHAAWVPLLTHNHCSDIFASVISKFLSFGIFEKKRIAVLERVSSAPRSPGC